MSNAILYNKPGTPFYKAAQRLQVSSQALFKELEDKLASVGVWRPASYSHKQDQEDPDAMDTLTNTQTSIGSLEPHLGVLDLLFSEDAIKDDIDYILSEDPLTSLFNFELGKLKPPPPPPPPKPPKPKRDRKAEAERRKLYLQAKATEARDTQTALDISPGFRAPRTRKGLAAAAAFEAEAHAEGAFGEDDGDDVDIEDGEHLNPAERHSRKEAAKQRIRRPPTVLPGQAEIPPIVDEVDNRQSFKMFDAGWILPENTKRGGRAITDRPPLPPPRKRVKLSSCLALISLFALTDHSSHRS